MGDVTSAFEKISSTLHIRKKKILLVSGISLILIALMIILLSIFVPRKSHLDEKTHWNALQFKAPNCSGKIDGYSYSSVYKGYKNAAVAVDSSFCSTIGKNVLLENGSAVDAAIASAICNGISNPQSMGIGGGHFMQIYLKDQKKMIGIDSREVAPINSTEDMFLKNPHLSFIGGLSTAVPGEIAGYWKAYQIAGKLPWKRLFEPTIALCKNGFPLSIEVAYALEVSKDYVRQDKVLLDMFTNPTTKQFYKKNEIIKLPNLANTLEIIANGGAKAFYEGELASVIVEEIRMKGGIITSDDLKTFKPVIRTPVEVRLNNNLRVFALPPPSSGVLVTFIMNVMSRFNLTESSISTTEKLVTFHHRLIESFKHTFAKRSFLGDSDFVDVTEILKNLTNPTYIDDIVKRIIDDETFPEKYYNPGWPTQVDHGTSHICVLAENGDAVSMTSSINAFFGGAYAGEMTGIIYNNEMDDFSTNGTSNYYNIPASEANFIKPGKKPMSSMSPLIILDEKDNVRLIIGGVGGSHIITAVASVAVKNIWLGQTIKDAIDAPQIHHQLSPNSILFESYMPESLFPQRELIEGLMRKKHNVSCDEFAFAIVDAIERRSDGKIYASSDFRKEGDVDGY